MEHSNQILRLVLITLGAALFLYAAGSFLLRLLIAAIGIGLILLGLSNGSTFYAMRRYRR